MNPGPPIGFVGIALVEPHPRKTIKKKEKTKVCAKETQKSMKL